MFDTIIIATGGLASVRRATSVAVGLAERFDASVHALYVVDTGDVGTAPDRLRNEIHDAPTKRGEEALAEVEAATDHEVTVAVREGRSATEVSSYTREVDTGAVTMGIWGRHGENHFLISGVAKYIMRTCPMPMLTVRQLEERTTDSLLGDEAA